MGSVWSDTAGLPQFPPLREDARTEVLIIGGGIAGLLCAWQLARRGVDYILLEADRICRGITKNTTAKITAQHGLIYGKLIREFGVERARMYLEANLAALAEYRALCAGGIDCDFEDKDNYIYTLRDPKRTAGEMAALERLQYPARLADRLPLPFPAAGAVMFPRQAQFHPLKFAAAIARGLRVYEQTPVRELAPRRAYTAHGRVSARQIVVCTHYPILNKHGAYYLKLYQHRSYVVALENAPLPDGMFAEAADAGMSFRAYRDLLLLGGGGGRTGKCGGGWQALEEFASGAYPGARLRYRWATQDCMTLDGAPYIGPYSGGSRGLYVATGFNKWGMSSAMVSAMLLADLLTGVKNPYAPVFAPDRSILRPQLAVNAGEALRSLVTPARRRCPHLGCALKWNPLERSWDCPCHGSRFREDGKLINDPATGDLK